MKIDSTEYGINSWYAELIADNKLIQDPAQAELISKLADLTKRLQESASAVSNHGIKSFFSKSISRFHSINGYNKAKSGDNKGIYIHGSVGRGKTLLMDGFYLNLNLQAKKRVHFHAFMRHFHQRIKDKKLKPEQLAAEISKECRVLCFDEFHISDIADAMIMQRLLEHFVKDGLVLIMTSNYHPDNLYPNGLARHLFMPAIDIIKENMEVFSLDAQINESNGSANELVDYRRTHIRDGQTYFQGKNAEAKMDEIFTKIACGIYLDKHITIQGRKLLVVQRTSDAIWFDFAELCAKARSKLDYLRLADRFSAVFVSNLPQLVGAELSEAARRWTWLVDIFYDRKVRLFISSPVVLEELYGEVADPNVKLRMDESGRTMSRLIEMQSTVYAKQDPIT